MVTCIGKLLNKGLQDIRCSPELLESMLGLYDVNKIATLRSVRVGLIGTLVTYSDNVLTTSTKDYHHRN